MEELVITCTKCAKDFRISWSGANHDPIQCPNCSLKLNKNLSEQALYALSVVHDLNCEIIKANSEYGEPLFKVSACHSTYPVSD